MKSDAISFTEVKKGEVEEDDEYKDCNSMAKLVDHVVGKGSAGVASDRNEVIASHEELDEMD